MPGRMPHSLLLAVALVGGPVFAAALPLSGRPPLEVAQWRWAEAIQDRQPIGNYQHYAPAEPLYLWLDHLHGTQAAVDDLRHAGPLRIEVHWRRENGATPGAPDLVTDLSVGDPDLADRLEHEVRQQGYFDWPSWARKDRLSPGRWAVSLTYPDGRPVPCAVLSGACRFAIDIG